MAEDVFYICGGPSSGGASHISQYSVATGALLGRSVDSRINGVGGAIDPDSGDVFWTNFSNGTVLRCPPTPVDGVLGPVEVYISGLTGNPESMVFRGDYVYVGHADGGGIKRFDKATGALQKSWVPDRGSRGQDWIGLASDDRTMFYTSENGTIFRYDVETEAQLPIFVANTGLTNYSVIPRFGDNHVFVAGGPGINRYDPTGALVRSYVMQPAPYSFAASLSLDGKKLFFADYQSPNVWIVDVETGAGTEAPAFQQPGGSSFRAGGTFSLGGTQAIKVIEAMDRRPNFTRGRA